MPALDLRKTYKNLYTAPEGEFRLVTVPELQFIMVDGAGDPNTAEDYTKAVEWLYGVSYALKFAAKEAGNDFVVSSLEGLWWADDMSAFITRDKSKWSWTMMILMPDFIDAAMFEAAVKKATKPKKGEPPATLRLDRLHEGPSLQTLHVGSYDDEGPILKRLHDEIIPGEGFAFNGKHHEIYLSDPRKTEAPKLKTILRQPVRLG